ncbi:hypothetical protein PanWU01x14_289460 [Parasponia andersonii]|uniref:Uncharacterized protein n=1 Tax=Parasponia andersonii TaxID=3476 RepID=A0A2P5AYA5_PARAD|nr:hypothetical protein PanWU01x14_289460 [Parasponia andersonii]
MFLQTTNIYVLTMARRTPTVSSASHLDLVRHWKFKYRPYGQPFQRALTNRDSPNNDQAQSNHPNSHCDNNVERLPLPLARGNNARPPNISIHNLRIALDALTRLDDELVVGYRQSSFNKEIRAAALLSGFKHPTMNTFDGKKSSIGPYRSLQQPDRTLLGR